MKLNDRLSTLELDMPGLTEEQYDLFLEIVTAAVSTWTSVAAR